MPNSFVRAINTIDTLYKVFSKSYIDMKNDGTLNYFVCDFLMDENGLFYFLKIKDFSTDGERKTTKDWKISTKFANIQKQKVLENIAR